MAYGYYGGGGFGYSGGGRRGHSFGGYGPSMSMTFHEPVVTSILWVPAPYFGDVYWGGRSGFQPGWASYMEWMDDDIYDVWHDWQIDIGSSRLSRSEQRLRLMNTLRGRRRGSRDDIEELVERLLHTTEELGADEYGHVSHATSVTTTTTRATERQRREVARAVRDNEIDLGSADQDTEALMRGILRGDRDGFVLQYTERETTGGARQRRHTSPEDQAQLPPARQPLALQAPPPPRAAPQSPPMQWRAPDPPPSFAPRQVEPQSPQQYAAHAPPMQSEQPRRERVRYHRPRQETQQPAQQQLHSSSVMNTTTTTTTTTTSSDMQTGHGHGAQVDHLGQQMDAMMLEDKREEKERKEKKHRDKEERRSKKAKGKERSSDYEELALPAPPMQQYAGQGPSDMQQYASHGPSPMQQYAGQGLPNVQQYANRAPPLVHQYAGQGSSSVQQYGNQAPAPVQQYAGQAPSNIQQYGSQAPPPLPQYAGQESSSVKPYDPEGPPPLDYQNTQSGRSSKKKDKKGKGLLLGNDTGPFRR